MTEAVTLHSESETLSATLYGRLPARRAADEMFAVILAFVTRGL